MYLEIISLKKKQLLRWDSGYCGFLLLWLSFCFVLFFGFLNFQGIRAPKGGDYSDRIRWWNMRMGIQRSRRGGMLGTENQNYTEWIGRKTSSSVAEFGHNEGQSSHCASSRLCQLPRKETVNTLSSETRNNPVSKQWAHEEAIHARQGHKFLKVTVTSIILLPAN